MENSKEYSPTDGRAGIVLPPAPKMEPADYLPDLDGLDITEARKIELLETLWNMMGSIARMGFTMDICGLIFEEFNEASGAESGDGTLIASTHRETPSKDDGREGIA